MKRSQNMQEIKKKLLQLIIERGLEDDDLIQTPENVLSLQMPWCMRLSRKNSSKAKNENPSILPTVKDIN